MADEVSFPSPDTLLRASPAAVPAPEPSKPKHVRRQSKETKKASLKKAPVATVDKPKQCKSRNGNARHAMALNVAATTVATARARC